MRAEGMSSRATPRSEVSMGYSLAELLAAFVFVSLLLGLWVGRDSWLAACIALVVGITLARRDWLGTTALRRRAGWGVSLFALSWLALLAVAYFLFGVGPVVLKSQWPLGLQEMVDETQASYWDVNAYCHSDFLDSEHVWRIKLPSESLEAALNSMAYEEGYEARLTQASIPIQFRELFPWRWRPSLRGDRRFYTTAEFPAASRGDDGVHCFAMFDPDAEQFYVWYKYNF